VPKSPPMERRPRRRRRAFIALRGFRVSRFPQLNEARFSQTRPESVDFGCLGFVNNSGKNFRFPRSISLDGARLETSVGPVTGGISNSSYSAEALKEFSGATVTEYSKLAERQGRCRPSSVSIPWSCNIAITVFR
jgi:hypothetical protein